MELLRKDIADMSKSLHRELASLKTDVASLTNDVRALQRFKSKMEDAEAREANITELELNNTIRQHLERVYPGYNLQDLGNMFKTIKHHLTGQRLTDFDGIFQLSQRMGNDVHDKKLVIIEAKRYIDVEKLDKKLVQMKTLRKMISIARSGNFFKTTRVFRETARTLKLAEYDPNVMFFAGASIWAPEALEKAKTSAVKIVRPSGRRYEVEDDMDVAPHTVFARFGGGYAEARRGRRQPSADVPCLSQNNLSA